ncbi:hypothetical protein [Escherichia coli]|uniref:F4 family fimbrial subunit n=1 Tax=Escherichia coli TaxID=562 RepID=UPI000B7E90F0|nr:hypothetical protein [Escherichia coli]EEV7649504.1 hypothetical protein [Escherichia coli]
MNMKKTMIALAVVSGAFISGNVMASDWTPNGTGGSVELGGTLTPVAKVTPWSVEVGNVVRDLDVQVQKGQKLASIPVKKSILFLGIAPNEGAFRGQKGINPQIDYNGFVDIDGFDDGVTKVKLPVKDKEQKNIGYMEADFKAAALMQWAYAPDSSIVRHSVYAEEPGQAFYGGVAKNSNGVLAGKSVEAFLNGLDPLITKGIWTNTHWRDANTASYDEDGKEWRYQGYYGSGIVEGSTMQISLDKAIGSDGPVEWHATMPISVTYQ